MGGHNLHGGGANGGEILLDLGEFAHHLGVILSDHLTHDLVISGGGGLQALFHCGLIG